MNTDNTKNCKFCGSTLPKRLKACPHCGKDQRNFFMKHKIITVILALVVMGGIGSSLSEQEKNSIEYVPYKYGDIVKNNNVVKEAKFKMPKDIEISIQKQSVVTIAELTAANPFNQANNDIAVIEITMTNNSKEPVSYNSLGFSYATHNGVQLKDFNISLNVLPDKYNSLDSFGSGDLMPGMTFTRQLTVEIPESDTVGTIEWNYSGVQFTVKLPK